MHAARSPAPVPGRFERRFNEHGTRPQFHPGAGREPVSAPPRQPPRVPSAPRERDSPLGDSEKPFRSADGKKRTRATKEGLTREASGGGPEPQKKHAASCKKSSTVPTLGAAALLFLFFLLVTSDVFVNSVLGCFQGATEGRAATAYGTVLQGVFLVVVYIAAGAALDQGLL